MEALRQRNTSSSFALWDGDVMANHPWAWSPGPMPPSSSGPGHRPLTTETGDRDSVGAPKRRKRCSRCHKLSELARKVDGLGIICWKCALVEVGRAFNALK